MQKSGGCSNPVQVYALRLGRYPDSDSPSRYCLSLASLASLAVNVSLLKLSNEGAARQGNKEFQQFLYIALGSASELDTQIEISGKIGFSDGHRLDEVQKHLETISKMIQGLIHSVKRKGL